MTKPVRSLNMRSGSARSETTDRSAHSSAPPLDAIFTLDYARINSTMSRRKRVLHALLIGTVTLICITVVADALVEGLVYRRISCGKTSLTRASVGRNGVLANEIRQFELDIGELPIALSELIDRPTESSKARNWKGPYLAESNDLLDAWDRPFHYRGGSNAAHNRGRFDLWSVGPDGIDGSADDIGNW